MSKAGFELVKTSNANHYTGGTILEVERRNSYSSARIMQLAGKLL